MSEFQHCCRSLATTGVLALAACSPSPDAPPAADQGSESERTLQAPPGPTVKQNENAVGSRNVPWDSLGRWGALFRLEDPDPSAASQFITVVQATPGVTRTILLETTLSWGCACPTWVYPFHDDMSALQYVMVLPAVNVDGDPTELAIPRIQFRMSGHFSGEMLTGLEWIERLGDRPPGFPSGAIDGPEVQEYWTEPGLAFIAESWCYERGTVEPEDKASLSELGAVQCAD